MLLPGLGDLNNSPSSSVKNFTCTDTTHFTLVHESDYEERQWKQPHPLGSSRNCNTGTACWLRFGQLCFSIAELVFLQMQRRAKVLFDSLGNGSWHALMKCRSVFVCWLSDSFLFKTNVGLKNGRNTSNGSWGELGPPMRIWRSQIARKHLIRPQNQENLCFPIFVV